MLDFDYCSKVSVKEVFKLSRVGIARRKCPWVACPPLNVIKDIN